MSDALDAVAAIEAEHPELAMFAEMVEDDRDILDIGNAIRNFEASEAGKGLRVPREWVERLMVAWEAWDEDEAAAMDAADRHEREGK